MATLEEKLKSIKSEIRSLLISCPIGLNLGRFLKDYHECLGNQLPFREFGYKTAWDFLLSMPDVVQIKETTVEKLLVPVETKLNSHIHQLVSEQRKLNDGHRRHRSRRKSAYVNFNHSYFTIERKKKSRKIRKKPSFDSADESSFISDFDELCMTRSDHVSTSQTMKYKKKGFSKSLVAQQSTNKSLNNVSPGSLKSLKLKSDSPELIREIPTEEIERFGNVQRHLPLGSEDDDFSSSDEIQVLYQLKKATCYTFSSDTDESVLTESLPECEQFDCRQSNSEILDSEEGEDRLNVKTLASHREEECSNDLSGLYIKDYSPPHALPKNCSADIENEISYQKQRFPSCEVLAENRELGNQDFSQTGALEVQMIVSEEHDRYLSALAHGIILDPDKILEPYKGHFTINEENINYADSSISSLHDNSAVNFSDSSTSKIFSEFISSKSQNNYNTSEITSLSSEQTSDSYDRSVRSNNDRTTVLQTKSSKHDFESTNSNSRIISEFKKMISSRNLQNNNKLSESNNSLTTDEIHVINAISDVESITRNIGRGSLLKHLYDAYQMRMISNKAEDSSQTQGKGRGQFLKKLVERRRHSHL